MFLQVDNGYPKNFRSVWLKCQSRKKRDTDDAAFLDAIRRELENAKRSFGVDGLDGENPLDVQSRGLNEAVEAADCDADCNADISPENSP